MLSLAQILTYLRVDPRVYYFQEIYDTLYKESDI